MRRVINVRVLLPVLLGAAVLALSACGGDDDEATEVQVDLQEFAVIPSETSVPAGEVTFQIENIGEETHELVVIRTDLDITALPTENDGSVSEAGEGLEVVDEVEDIPAGESEELTVDLEAGSYALICNIVEEEDGETESHYQEGMRASLTVE